MSNLEEETYVTDLEELEGHGLLQASDLKRSYVALWESRVIGT